jgi:hypothetical protein
VVSEPGSVDQVRPAMAKKKKKKKTCLKKEKKYGESRCLFFKDLESSRMVVLKGQNSARM